MSTFDPYEMPDLPAFLDRRGKKPEDPPKTCNPLQKPSKRSEICENQRRLLKKQGVLSKMTRKIRLFPRGALYYVLDENHEPVPATMMAWARFFEDRDKCRVARDEIDGVVISTVFLGLNHQWIDGPPLIFETMIFGGQHDDWMQRTSTWAEAEETHAFAVAMVKQGNPHA